MHFRLGKFIRSFAVLALTAAGLTTVTSPARAAVPDPVFIQTMTPPHACLFQYYFGGPSVSLGVTYDCQQDRLFQWGVHRHPGTDFYRIVNHSTGWCLSHPNPVQSSPVYAEICINDLKQLWMLEPRPEGGAFFINGSTGFCLMPGAPPYGWGCVRTSGSPTARWMWSTVPA